MVEKSELYTIGGVAFSRDPSARSLSFFAQSPEVAVTNQMIADLLDLSSAHEHCNARLCLHSGPEALFHNMIVLEYRDRRYYRPHRHAAKAESCHIISGDLAIILFDDCGKITWSSVLHAGGEMLARIPSGTWHTVVPVSEYVVYHESKSGPFDMAGDSVYPSWAPDGGDEGESRRYIERLYTEVVP